MRLYNCTDNLTELNGTMVQNGGWDMPTAQNIPQTMRQSYATYGHIMQDLYSRHNAIHTEILDATQFLPNGGSNRTFPSSPHAASLNGSLHGEGVITDCSIHIYIYIYISWLPVTRIRNSS